MRDDSTCRVRYASTGYVIRDTSTTHERGASIRGQVHRDSACQGIHGTSAGMYAATVPVVEYIAPVPSVSYVAPAPVGYVAPAPVVEHIARWP